jgi:hypothetical protein
LPLHQQAGFFQYLGHRTTANLTEDVVEHAQIFQDTGNTQHNINFYQLRIGILNLWHYRAGGCTVLVLKNVTFRQLDHVHMQGIANEGQQQKSVIRL